MQGDLPGEIDFIPMRGPFSRGILAAVYTRCEASLDELKALDAELGKLKVYGHRGFSR